MDARNPDAPDLVGDEFARAVIEGLGGHDKQIPCQFLYDAKGSELFEQITHLAEYYPTRTEIGLLERFGPDIADLAGPGCALIEFGSGSSRKTHILIESLTQIAAYVPIDIADDALAEAAKRIERAFPGLPLHPVHADFNQDIDLPNEIEGAPKLGFFPGSTIGNFSHDQAAEFLQGAAGLLGPGSGFLIGVDLKKDVDILLAAYNDAKGITAEFNLNLLERINRQLAGDIDLTKFAHEAIYNAQEGRVEIYAVSLADQQFSAAGYGFALKKGERIHTENSYKYSVDEFQAMATRSGWKPVQVWTDEDQLFSLHYLARI